MAGAPGLHFQLVQQVVERVQCTCLEHAQTHNLSTEGMNVMGHQRSHTIVAHHIVQVIV